MFFQSGPEFEKAIFGVSSKGSELVKKWTGRKDNFSQDIKTLLRCVRRPCPPTKIAEVLYDQIMRAFASRGVRADSLILASTVDTKVDAYYGTDGLLYLPSFHPYLVTLDAFNIAQGSEKALRNKWIDLSQHEVYGDTDFQSDLYRFKKGIFEARKERTTSQGELFSPAIDFRLYSESLRPENHFILTPLSVSDYRHRRDFARLVVDCFLQADKRRISA